ncbi:MAG: hypothetical protein CFE38_13475 [Comamonadaceae bacterium PBBC1]|nr:MAG: hypothetical protein CFE38_13475 [Comamonadaceae bacterium PBBC1]
MGLFGVQVGTVTMAQVDKQIDRTSLGATLNSYYVSAFGAQTTAQVAATLVSNLGITGAGVADAVAYVTAKLNATAPAARGEEIASIINMFSGMTNDAVYGTAAKTWNANVDAAAAYAGAANVAFGSVIQQSLTEGMDVLFGSSLADQFNADLTAGGNTLQSGDRLDGGAGNDTLHAILGTNGDQFAITAKTSNIEKVIVQAQALAADTGDNNVAGMGESVYGLQGWYGDNFATNNVVKVDAGRMNGVNQWENNNSRADLFVEDVRIGDNQITKDITITMRETDPGNVDFAVYFDQNSLRNSSASTSQINLQVMDTRAVVDGKAPLLNSPYGGFKFTATDSKGVATVVTLQSDAIDAAQTYTELAAAFQAAADKQFGAGAVTVTVGSDFSVTDTTTAQSVSGKEVVMKTSSAYTFTTPAGSGWVAAGVVPANSGLHTNFSQGSTTNSDPVTSTIVLDDVGRGSTGGDLVVGGLSVGDTSTSKGVQRFDITVEDNSKLQNIDSTNNTLREVSIVNGTTTRMTDAYTKTVKDAGNLTVKGNWNDTNQGNALPGAVSDNYGFNDVRLIEASTFKGMLDIDAVLSDNVTAKYLNLADTAPDAPAADNVTFAYNLGTNNDKFSLDIDASNLQASGTTTREDFVLSINGGAGKDAISVDIINGGYEDGSAAWYNNSKLNANLSIDGGAGDDTIKTKGGGDWKVTAGDGDDTVYSDNSGDKAVWVFNTTEQAGAAVAGSALTLTDLKSSANTKYNLYKGVAEVTFRGLTSKVTIDSTAYITTDLQINQAIKKAINSDAVLSKLLLATDGPANTLVVTSLIDGKVEVKDLAVAITKPAAGVLTAADIAAAFTAYALTGTATEAQVLTAMDDTTMDAVGGDYAANFGVNVTTVNQTPSYAFAEGSDSAKVADSTHTLGAGNDVLVLSTDALGATNLSSNEKVVYNAVAFGNDVIVNFEVAGDGIDTMDFTALGGKKTAFSATATTTDGLIMIVDTATANNTEAAIKTALAAADDTVASKGIYVAYNATTNVGTVYQIVDGTAAADLTVTAIGTIDLADTPWASLTAANFA